MNIATFFIADDEPILHELYRDILKIKGHDVCGVAFNGHECYEHLTNSTTDPDFIILDHRMPMLNGLDVMKRLLDVKPNLKIIFVSADISARRKALKAGALIFVKKPFNLNTFFNSLDRLIKHEQKMAQEIKI
ncbi:MAG: response regulator [Thermoplasmata archaeon]|nr:MAG: response regulator [Thermoplasmata archaeon]